MNKAKNDYESRLTVLPRQMRESKLHHTRSNSNLRRYLVWDIQILERNPNPLYEGAETASKERNILCSSASFDGFKSVAGTLKMVLLS